MHLKHSASETLPRETSSCFSSWEPGQLCSWSGRSFLFLCHPLSFIPSWLKQRVRF